MGSFFLKRIFSLFLTLLGLSVVVFMIVHLLPGDPAQVILGERATPQAIEELRQQLGFNKPLILQYFTYLWELLQGNLGTSILSNQDIGQLISEKFPATLELTFTSLVISIFFGMTFGIIAAAKKDSFFDGAVMVGALAGISMPIFWLALILLYVFSVELRWFPVTGRLPADMFYQSRTHFILLDSLVDGRFDVFLKALHHLVLPAVALSTIPMAIIARITRSAVIDTLTQDYIRTARAKGLSEKLVLLKHALKNAMIPILTVIGLQFGLLLGGAIITETIFAWPGMGTFLLNSVYGRDYPAVQGGVLTVGASFIFVNLLVDLTYGFVDPRVRARIAGGKG